MPDGPYPFRVASPLRAVVYGGLWRMGDLLSRAARACEYLAVGVLRRRDLQQAMQLQFRAFGDAPEEVDEGLNPFERQVYSRWLRPSSRVLLVGCGAGRDLLGLTRLAHVVVGVEQSVDLAGAARAHLARHGLPASVVASPIEAVEVQGPFDAIIFAPSCYSNMRSSEVRVATLSRLCPQLAPGGRLFIHFIANDSRSRAALALMRTSAGMTGTDWQPERGDTFSRHRESPDVPYYYHSFGPGEVEGEGTAAGFHLMDTYLCADRSDCAVFEVDPASRAHEATGPSGPRETSL